MKKTHKTLIILLIACMAGSCLSNQKDKLAVDILDLYKPLKLPLVIGDTIFSNTFADTSLSRSDLSLLIPDSALKTISKDTLLRAYPYGKINTEDVLYLITRITAKKKTSLLVFALNNENTYKSHVKLLEPGNRGYSQSVSITSEPAFIVNTEKRSKDLLYTKNGYAFNKQTGKFEQVMHDSNEDEPQDIINPIDSLPANRKYSGDYVSDKKNFISVRDGRNESTYYFFIHFEKAGGECTGELKGEMHIIGDGKAIFSESGDPCGMTFTFFKTSIKVKEEGNCGNHRGITCPYDFTFRKKRTASKN